MSLRNSFNAAKVAQKVFPTTIPGLPNLNEFGGPILEQNTYQPLCDYFVRVMTLGERESFEFAISKRNGDKVEVSHEHVRSELLLRTLCEQDGTRLFGDDEGDVLRGVEGADFLPAFLLAQKINGLAGGEKNS